MKKIVCPRCGSEEFHHYTDAYVLRSPIIDDEGGIQLLDSHTNEYDDCFFECFRCGCRPTEDELLAQGDVIETATSITPRSKKALNA
jgi:predicted nucleic-acid-binding Zn-ribbon protein